MKRSLTFFSMILTAQNYKINKTVAGLNFFSQLNYFTMNSVFFKTRTSCKVAMSMADQSVLEIETGYTGEGQLFISNTSGQTVLESKITNNGTNQQIDLSNLTISGMYIVTLINESGITSKKINVH